MSVSRYDAVAARKYEDRDGNEKTAYTNIGVAWRNKSGSGYTVRLNAIPAPDNGEYVILLFEPKTDGGGRQQRGQRNTQQDNLDDEIPF